MGVMTYFSQPHSCEQHDQYQSASTRIPLGDRNDFVEQNVWMSAGVQGKCPTTRAHTRLYVGSNGEGFRGEASGTSWETQGEGGARQMPEAPHCAL